MASDYDSSQSIEISTKLNTIDLLINENFDNDLTLNDIYKLAFDFYKEQSGKALHLSYEDKLQLVAFSQQVLHGPLGVAIHKLPPLGTLDVVGKDRRLAWQKLGNLSNDQARNGFVDLLSRRCPLFTAYVEAHRREKNEQARKAKEEEKLRLLEEEERIKRETESKLLKEQQIKEESIKRQIQKALNEQTFEQFHKYAKQQYPGDPEKQGGLIKQLQEQHYIQYMQQLQSTQRLDSNVKLQEEVEEEETEINDVAIENELVPASMWTRSDIDPFKQAVSQAEGDGVVRVGHGETVTVRVPTHPDGTRLFWEFSTDHYDIGFGVYFEYGTPATDRVSVHVSESDDEDLDEDEDEDEMGGYEDEDGVMRPMSNLNTGNDLEAGTTYLARHGRQSITEIVPVYRRDCQNEVYAGSHRYPGQGVYLLKFDNSYSLWRSKTLYYRVYYTK